eukprot:994341-Pelagomonas_calceolata.AAC.1
MQEPDLGRRSGLKTRQCASRLEKSSRLDKDAGWGEAGLDRDAECGEMAHAHLCNNGGLFVPATDEFEVEVPAHVEEHKAASTQPEGTTRTLLTPGWKHRAQSGLEMDSAIREPSRLQTSDPTSSFPDPTDSTDPTTAPLAATLIKQFQ